MKAFKIHCSCSESMCCQQKIDNFREDFFRSFVLKVCAINEYGNFLSRYDYWSQTYNFHLIHVISFESLAMMDYRFCDFCRFLPISTSCWYKILSLVLTNRKQWQMKQEWRRREKIVWINHYHTISYIISYELKISSIILNCIWGISSVKYIQWSSLVTNTAITKERL